MGGKKNFSKGARKCGVRLRQGWSRRLRGAVNCCGLLVLESALGGGRGVGRVEKVELAPADRLRRNLGKFWWRSGENSGVAYKILQ